MLTIIISQQNMSMYMDSVLLENRHTFKTGRWTRYTANENTSRAEYVFERI